MGFFASNGCQLYFEEKGDGAPLVFLHEFGGDTRSWEAQMDHFSSLYRCLALSCRGYPPSDVPGDDSGYGWQKNIDDVAALLDHLDIEQAHFVGLSMGAFNGLMLALQRPERVLSLVAASGGSGAFPPTRQEFIDSCLRLADAAIASSNMPAYHMAFGPARVQLREKNRASWDEFYAHLEEHPGIGSGMTQKWVQAARPSLHDFEAEFATLETPVLLMVGDEDDPCLDTNLWLKRVMPRSGLSIWPKSGHLLNLEDPYRFNGEIEAFHELIAAGKWPDRNKLLQRHAAPEGAIF
jgi:pimeloyl-ACP methyl ester carboxylesterase